MFRKFILISFLFLSLAASAFATNNDTIDTVLNITGNLPTSTIFFAVDGEPDTGSITLEPNQTTTLSCWGVASDLDGLNDLADLYTVIYANTTTRFADLNDSVLYRANSTSGCDMTNWNVDGSWNCTYEVQYFAQPVNWTCAINITNTDPQFYNDSISTESVVEELVSLYVHNRTVDFGTRAVDTTSEAETPVLVYNTGNVILDLQLDAFNRSSTFTDDSTQAFNCTISSIPIDFLRFSLNENEPYVTSVSMEAVGATATQSFGLAPQFGGSGSVLPTSEFTYWAVGIPNNVAGQCTGHIMYIGLVAE